MPRQRNTVNGPFAAWLVGLFLVSASCSSPADPPLDPACDSSAQISLDPPAETTSSSRDVETILARSCALGGCHAGDPGAAELTLPLASGAWIANVVNRPSRENPAMMLVEPSDPAKSWMVQKLTCNQCSFASTCDARLGCGQCMPFGQPLDLADMTTVFVWVRSGAPR
jgi:hypothetical protein